MAGGIAVVRSGVGYVEDSDEVLDIVLLATGLARQRVKQQKVARFSLAVPRAE